MVVIIRLYEPICTNGIRERWEASFESFNHVLNVGRELIYGPSFIYEAHAVSVAPNPPN